MFLVMTMHPHIKKHNKPATPDAWIRFPWEKLPELTAESAEVTQEETERLNALLERFKATR